MTKFSAQQQSQLAQIGVFLRETREQQGKSLEDIAIRTYIRPQLLNGIESGDPELLPEPIFVQGFIRRYAENLGLKGTELAQQFSVDSIPSTPRPVRQAVPEDSPTTRLTRLSTGANTGTDAAKESSAEAATGAAMFSAGSASALEDSLITASAPAADAVKPDAASPNQSPTEVPLIVDNAVLDMQQAQAEKIVADSTPAETALAGSSDDFQKLLDDAAAGDSNSTGADGFSFGADAFAGTTEGSTLPASDLPTADLPGSEDAFASKVAEFDRQNLASPTDAEASESASAVSNSSFDDDLPAAFTTAATPTVTGANVAPTTPAYVNPEPVGVDYARPEGPNLKPFVIGGLVAALLTAAVVAVASLFGGGDRTPAVADNPTTEEPAVTELETVGSETLPPIPDEPDRPAASTAPLYVEAEATAEAWVSVIADGTPLFEGTLQPGDTVVWEGQEIINIYSGDAGALEVSQNGESATVMGERGQPEEKIFTLN